MMTLGITSGPATSADSSVTGQGTTLTVPEVICRLVQQAQHTSGSERRYGQRAPYPHLIRLTPVARPNMQPIDHSAYGIGRFLGPRGLDFYHPMPLASRHLMAVFEEVAAVPALLLAVRWSRFLRQGCYLSGGRFLGVIAASDENEDSVEDVPNAMWMHSRPVHGL